MLFTFKTTFSLQIFNILNNLFTFLLNYFIIFCSLDKSEVCVVKVMFGLRVVNLSMGMGKRRRLWEVILRFRFVFNVRDWGHIHELFMFTWALWEFHRKLIFNAARIILTAATFYWFFINFIELNRLNFIIKLFSF